MAAWQEEDWLLSLDRRLVAWFWRPGYPRQGPAGWGHLAAQVLYLALRGSYLDRLPFQANALTFMTLLGLVPALAISFAVAKGFGFAGTLERLLVDNEFLASQAQVFRQIITYVQNTQVGTLGVVGLAVLLITLLWTLSSVEETFNRVWEVPVPRTLLRRFTDYLSVLVICPLLVVASAAIWAGFSSNAAMRWLLGLAVLGPVAETGLGLGPFLLLAAAFVFMYLFLPNTRVPFWPALVSGLVAAGLWWGVQSLYIFFQVGVARYNAIYGGFASLPLFFIWVQVSWMVLLFGNELARAHHVCRHGPLPRALLPRLSPAQRQELALRLMFRVVLRFHQGARPANPEDLAGELGLSLGEVERVLECLMRAGLLTPPDAQRRVMPARSLSTILVAQVVEAVQGRLEPDALGSPQPGEERLFALLERAAQCGRQALGEVNFAELLSEHKPRP
ncbi:MAG: YhjD/YihY/BrkB family envelope integrity protein [Pseudomonadota bacterium]